jgi:hypothetical protein
MVLQESPLGLCVGLASFHCKFCSGYRHGGYGMNNWAYICVLLVVALSSLCTKCSEGKPLFWKLTHIEFLNYHTLRIFDFKLRSKHFDKVFIQEYVRCEDITVVIVKNVVFLEVMTCGCY